MSCLKLLGVGVSTSYGAGLTETLKRSSQRRSSYYKNPSFYNQCFEEQICAFRVPNKISHFLIRCENLVEEALRDFSCVADANARAFDQGLSISIISPEIESLVTKDSLKVLSNKITRIVSKHFDLSDSKIRGINIIPWASAGFGEALSIELSKTDTEEVPHLIILCDSFNDVDRLQALSAKNLLFSKDNGYGLIPGEAAGVFWFERCAYKIRASGTFILGAGKGLESVIEGNNAQNSSSVGMSEAVLLALEAATPFFGEIGTSILVSDYNNSRYKASELAYAVTRAGTTNLNADLNLLYPSERYGDCGAGFGVTAFVEWHRKMLNRSSHNIGVITAGARHSGARTAFVIETKDT